MGQQAVCGLQARRRRGRDASGRAAAPGGGQQRYPGGARRGAAPARVLHGVAGFARPSLPGPDTRQASARCAGAAAAQQAPLAGLGLGLGDGAPQGPLRAAVAAVLAEHRAGAESARREPTRYAQLQAAGQVVTMLLAREADLAGMVAAGERALGTAERSMRGYPARPFETHLTEALAELAAGTPV